MINDSYRSLLETSRRVNWRVEDLIGGEHQLDFSRPFLPETYARTAGLAFLSAPERLALNHIRAHGYLALFELVETFIVPFISAQADTAPKGEDPDRSAALWNFTEEENKHMRLFQCFREDFTTRFGTECAVIGPADAIAGAILAHSPLAVTMLVLHAEWMSQCHYVESVRDDTALDPTFRRMLRHHWLEEAQHARLDALLLQSLASRCSAEDARRALDEYFEMVKFFDAGLEQQARLDLQSLQARTGRTWTAQEQETLVTTQHQGLRWTILGSAMRNASFLGVVEQLGREHRERIERAAADYC